MERTRPNHESSAAAEFVAQVIRQRHSEPTGIFHAPGRVNLIGEHTDYNDGFVMPAALAFYTTVAAAPRNDRKLQVYSIDFDEAREFALGDVAPGPTGHWSDYPRGVAGVLQTSGVTLRGANLVIKGDVPIGAGLSSSAAIEVATAFALLAVTRTRLERREIASICQQAEHEYAGTKCGIMDQFISCFGQADHALLLDCRSLQYEPVKIASRARIVVCNTMVRHELAAGEYNLRRADCEDGVKYLQQHLPDIRALRDVGSAQLVEFGRGMPDRIYRRCRHVIAENARTLEAAKALKQGDLEQFGTLMGESHESLRGDYEVSCRELDLMVAIAGNCRGVYGARMTGGGFGGCTVNLVEADAVEAFQTAVLHQYETATGIHPEIYVCRAANGAGEVS